MPAPDQGEQAGDTGPDQGEACWLGHGDAVRGGGEAVEAGAVTGEISACDLPRGVGADDEGAPGRARRVAGAPHSPAGCSAGCGQQGASRRGRWIGHGPGSPGHQVLLRQGGTPVMLRQHACGQLHELILQCRSVSLAQGACTGVVRDAPAPEGWRLRRRMGERMRGNKGGERCSSRPAHGPHRGATARAGGTGLGGVLDRAKPGVGVKQGDGVKPGNKCHGTPFQSQAAGRPSWLPSHAGRTNRRRTCMM